jgi:hypothetical protein
MEGNQTNIFEASLEELLRQVVIVGGFRIRNFISIDDDDSPYHHLGRESSYYELARALNDS